MRIIFFQGMTIVCCLYALWRGGRDERTAACAYAGAAILTALIQHPYSPIRFEGGILVVDALLYLIFVSLALVSQRFWPIWLTWLQGADVICQFAMLYDPALSTPIYRDLVGLWAYPILLLIAAATWRRRRERAF